MPDIEYYIGAYTGEEIDEYLGKAKNGSNPNLLDNWYFVGGGTGDGVFPVNQRGNTTYTQGAGMLKVVDRWQLTRGTATLTGNGLTLKWGGSSVGGTGGILRQAIYGTPFTGKTVTLSLLYGNSPPLSVTTTMTENTNVYSSVVDNVLLHIFVINGNTLIDIERRSETAVTLIAAKLELGDTQTLAHQENGVWVLTAIPNYAEELLKCQRYLFLLSRYNATRATAVRSDHVYFSIPIPVQLAKQPTLINESYLSVQAVTGSGASGFAFSVSQYAGNYIQIDASKTAHGLSDAVLSYGTTAPGVFISAEL